MKNYFIKKMSGIITKTIISILFFLTLTACTQNNTMIYQMPTEKLQTKWFTAENVNAEKGKGGQTKHGRKGSPLVWLNPGEPVVIADIKGNGTINRMWFTLWKREAKDLRGIKLEIYWDDAKIPAVQVPFGDFMCQSLGTMTAFENVFFSSPEAKSFNCFIQMPFKKAAKILLINESDERNAVYYDIACTTGSKHDDNMLYFHSGWQRNQSTKMREDFNILPKVEGKGKFLGCHLGVIQNPTLDNFWWGEGEVKIFLDGDSKFPSLCGTGTEDYIGTGYGQGKFDHLYQGNQYLSEEKNKNGFYRFHVPDPVYFYENISVDIQVMGGGKFSQFLKSMDKDPDLKLMKTGKGGEFYSREELVDNPGDSTVEREGDDFCATAYWYMDCPTNSLPPLAPYKDRISGLK